MEVALIGEGMLELSGREGGWRLGYGGDTLNTAVHLARFGRDVAFLSAVGADPFSTELLGAWAAEGVDVSHVLVDPVHSTGLYAIRTDDAGERSFTYWRSDSAARAMFSLSGIEAMLEAAEGAALLGFSLISLAILPAEAHDRLAVLCGAVRERGGRVFFDGNYRPLLWDSPAQACAAVERFTALSDIGFPTLSDEAMLYGAQSADEVADRWQQSGTGEVVVKLGSDGCLYRGPDMRMLVPPPAALDVVDSSGAGDAFNAGYLNAILKGARPAEACIEGHNLAGWVVRRPGAIPVRERDVLYA